MSRIFVTGGSGRLGRSVVAGLAEAGHKVISVDRDAIPAEQLPAGAEQYAADLLAPGEAERLIRETAPDAVIHLAAIAVPFSAPEDVIFSTNTRLAYAVVSAATDAGVPRIVTASSPHRLGLWFTGGLAAAVVPFERADTTQAVECIRAVQADRRADCADVRCRSRQQDQICGIPPVLRHFPPRGVGRSADTARAHGP